MSGFPTKPSRSAFGPRTFVNRSPWKNPEGQLGAEQGMLMAWQIAGLGIVSGRAVVIMSSAGVLDAHGEAWDPDQELADPGVAHPGPGVYEVTYPATAPDESGTETAIVLLGAHITCSGATALHGTWEIDPNGHKITFRIWNAAGAATNGAFLATVL